METRETTDAGTPGHAAGAGISRALAGLAALAVAMGIGRFAFTPVLPMMLQDGALTLPAGGLLASANYLGYLLGALSAMVVAVRPERAIRAGLLVIVATTLAMAAPLPYAGWLLLRLVAGIASAWVLISVSAWCMEALAIYRRPFLNSLVFAGVGSGIAAAGLLCLLLIGAGAHASGAWAALGLLAAALSLAAWRFLAPVHAAAAAAATGRSRFRWNADALRLVLCYGIFGFGYIIPATFLPVMARTALQGSPLFGWSWPVFGLAAALSTLCVAALVARFGNRRLWRWSHLVMAAGVVLPALSPGLLPVFIAALCVGGTFMVITLAALQEGKRVAGADARVLLAAMTAAFAAGQIIGPLTVGGNGFSSALIVAAAMLAGSAILLTSTSREPT
ncbi:YbfB/YjiJ family MFS transporter [Noviherbaspirillum aridicola]|uniref:MFS transporter n=1 Tax=Noviherbaspirillum aridicola TaxID=2849687 RepID=A0ABQ4PYR5_9BURK|nr:YbfB/YjiJ family MFS transporter [Noviherbaspirillum aridicola]GIZ50040.1 MFS transporter [Noviherbaspirillum aridicola]